MGEGCAERLCKLWLRLAPPLRRDGPLWICARSSRRRFVTQGASHRGVWESSAMSLRFCFASSSFALLLSGTLIACSSKSAPAHPSAGEKENKGLSQIDASGKAGDDEVAYDVRRLRPSEPELGAWFDRLIAQSIEDGKRPAVLFSASWCHACRDVEHELGNTHAASQIGGVRIFQLVEEDWEAATRMDEYNDLRARWHPELGTYPMFIVLDGKGEKVETMDEAKERLIAAGQDANFPTWFGGLPALSSEPT